MARTSVTPFIWELYRILFCIVLFFAFDLLKDISVKWWMKISFFIYCFHMYPLQLSQYGTTVSENVHTEIKALIEQYNYIIKTKIKLLKT